MLLIGFFLPFIPTVLVGGIIIYQLHSAASTDPLSDEQQARLGRATISSVAAVVVAGALIAANAFSLSRKMVARIQLADRNKERMIEQMYQTGKLAAIGELAAGTAHEINNPVAIMIEEAGWISDLLQDNALEDHPERQEIERAVRQIQAQGKRCKDITHKMLSFARETDFTFTEVELPVLVDDVVKISGKRAEHSNVQIRTEIQDDLPAARLPLTELQQVLYNLVNNALDAMEAAGGTLSISVTADGDLLRIVVADTGGGIPREHRQRIFDPFFTTKPVGRGTGLGLSICYGIVKRIGGDISVRSDPDRGATFVVSLPLNPEETGPEPPLTGGGHLENR
jgi:two-component system NtrC family sensor kinase